VVLPPSVPPPAAIDAVIVAPLCAKRAPSWSRSSTTGAGVSTTPLCAVLGGWVVTPSATARRGSVVSQATATRVNSEPASAANRDLRDLAQSAGLPFIEFVLRGWVRGGATK
jgi:hypothetical protein